MWAEVRLNPQPLTLPTGVSSLCTGRIYRLWWKTASWPSDAGGQTEKTKAILQALKSPGKAGAGWSLSLAQHRLQTVLNDFITLRLPRGGRAAVLFHNNWMKKCRWEHNSFQGLMNYLLIKETQRKGRAAWLWYKCPFYFIIYTHEIVAFINQEVNHLNGIPGILSNPVHRQIGSFYVSKITLQFF